MNDLEQGLIEMEAGGDRRLRGAVRRTAPCWPMPRSDDRRTHNRRGRWHNSRAMRAVLDRGSWCPHLWRDVAPHFRDEGLLAVADDSRACPSRAPGGPRPPQHRGSLARDVHRRPRHRPGVAVTHEPCLEDRTRAACADRDREDAARSGFCGLGGPGRAVALLAPKAPPCLATRRQTGRSATRFRS